MNAQPTASLPSAAPLPNPKLPTATQMTPGRTSLQRDEAVVGSTPTPPESRSPLATLVLPGPVFVQPGRGPFIFEPGQPPRLNTIIPPRTTPRSTSIGLPNDSLILASPDNVHFAAQPQKAHPSVLIFNNEAVTANSFGQFIIGSQTLVPGGAITVDSATLSLDAAGSYVVVNATSTIPIAQTPNPRQTDNSVSRDQGTMTAYHTTLVTLTLGGQTSTLPNGAVAVVGGSKRIITASISSGAKSLTLTYGGRTATLLDGRTSVIGGTRTVVAVPEATEMDSSRTTVRGDANAFQDGKSLSFVSGSTLQGDDWPTRGTMTPDRENGCGRVRVDSTDIILLGLGLFALYWI
jgi:hypothetical protein